MKKKLLFVLLSLTLIFSSFAFIGCFDSNEKKESDADCFVFDNGTITGLTNKGILQEKLVIPAQIMGQSVRSIDNYVFQNCNRLTSVTIPASVSSLGSSALSGCSTISNITVDGNNFNYSSLDGNLYNKNQTTLLRYAVGKTATSFSVPSTVTSIGLAAVSGAVNLTSVTIPSSVCSLGNGAFSLCSGLTQIDIPTNVESIGDYAFSQTGLTYVAIPSGVENIGNFAFYGCVNLESVTISSNVVSIGTSAFSECKRLQSITVDENNSVFSSLDGNLYNKNQTRIKQYAVAKTENIFTIPETVTSIGARAFEFSKNLDSIVIPSRIESIDNEIVCQRKHKSGNNRTVEC